MRVKDAGFKLLAAGQIHRYTSREPERQSPFTENQPEASNQQLVALSFSSRLATQSSQLLYTRMYIFFLSNIYPTIQQVSMKKRAKRNDA
jgi:hypothetical protein